MAEQTDNKSNNVNSGNNGGSGGPGSKLFREKSLERYSNPENLNDYLRVTSPGMWLLLGSVIVLLAGVCIWGFIGRIEVSKSAAVVTKDGTSLCMVPASGLQGVMDNHIVVIDGENLELSNFVQEPQTITESSNIMIVLAGGFSTGDVVYPVPLKEPLEEDGVEAASVVTEIISPAALFFDR